MIRRRGGSAPLAVLAALAAVAIGACGGAGVSPQPSANEPSTVDASGAASPPGPSPRTTDPPTTGALSEPPAASLSVDGGDPVVGELGSFTWRDHGSDSPWLGGRPIHIGSGETLALTLAEPIAIDAWTASRVAAATLDDTTAVGLRGGTGGDPVVFGGPPSGTWSVRVSVWFADNLGSATYYWRVEVD